MSNAILEPSGDFSAATREGGCPRRVRRDSLFFSPDPHPPRLQFGPLRPHAFGHGARYFFPAAHSPAALLPPLLTAPCPALTVSYSLQYYHHDYVHIASRATSAGSASSPSERSHSRPDRTASADWSEASKRPHRGTRAEAANAEERRETRHFSVLR